ncbi:NAD(P)/FAD-dependent oxidoreductase [Flavobacteriaceae bacterium XHP0103]|uniref:NAD(P)/FAD-dependent oxidoreductase n=1 Tax=Marixanthotalea marina TaxID=2844359 RepID=UPI002989B44B|nr:NAD(P)/FAD-dependent oxidoreductase [Marixanthotalea marina]MBU3821089.1 NAD(P)/FAD-dependent oxidoreductase [Marixanthotalea marina]
MIQKDVLVIGGGAAGFFAAINIAEANPNLKVAILERGKEVLTKVKVSGGGRCNVTHAEFIPQELVLNYPRGEKELLGPFHQFMTGDTIEWFEKRGVALKIEDDGRMFPITDSSQTIIDCFLKEVKKHKVEVLTNHSVKSIEKSGDIFEIETTQGVFQSKKVLVATGSNPKIWQLLEGLGHSIANPVPSLFTFNIKDERIKNIPGVVVNNVSVKVLDSDLESSGPLLVTHWGLSAPAILKLSAFGALEFAKKNYKFQIEINFIKMSFEDCVENLKNLKQRLAKKTVFKFAQFDVPKRLWHQLVLAIGIDNETRWADMNKEQLEALAAQLTQAVFRVDGKSTFKEEFVTAGGIDLKEVNFKTFESKLIPHLYFAGEVLNIDAVTGGFNFQNAWTSAFIAAKNIVK